MIKKWLLFLCWIYAFTASLSIFCMEEINLTDETEVINPILAFKWSIHFENTDEQFEKSYVFKTDKQDKNVILVQTNNYYYLFDYKKNDKKPTLINSFSNKNFPIIECYVPTAYKDKSDSYVFYITTKEKSIFSQEKYAVKKINISNTPRMKPIIDPLFEHNTPIMHICMITHNKKQYLVAGSFYPSIKIYDLKEKKEAIKPLHNRFLLSTTSDTLIYAKKQESHYYPRPYFGLERMLAYDLHKKYYSTIFTLNPFNGAEEKQTNYKKNIIIEFAKYPLMIKDTRLIFDRKNQKLLSIDQERFFDIRDLIPAKITRGEKIDISPLSDEQIHTTLVKLFSEDDLWTYFKTCMTYESFIKFAQENPQGTIQAYFNAIITDIVNMIMDPSPLAKGIKDQINSHLLGMILTTYASHEISFTEHSFNYFEKIITKNIFNLYNYLQEIKPDLFQDITIYKPQSTLLKDFQNIYRNDQDIIIERKNSIFKGPFLKNGPLLKECYSSKNEISNSYIFNNLLCIIDKDGLHEINLAQQPIHENYNIKLIYDPEEIAIVQKIITLLQEKKSILLLEKMFEQNNTFIIRSIQDILLTNKTFTKDTDLIWKMWYYIEDHFLKIILHEWIKSIAQEYQSFINKDTKFDDVVYALAHAIETNDIWNKDIIDAKDTNKPITDLIQEELSLKNKDNVILYFFPNLKTELNDLEESNKKEYAECINLLILHRCMENNNLIIDNKKQSYLAYVKNHLIKVAHQISGLKIEPINILHSANRWECGERKTKF